MKNENKRTVSIMLFEDDDVDAMGVRRALKKQRLPNPLIRAKNGREGLALMRERTLKQPFLVIMDLNMPLMNGMETLREIRDDPKLTKCVVFILTTSQAPEDIDSAYGLHVAGYIVKTSLANGLADFSQLLEHYWRLVELPVEQGQE